MAAIPHLEFPPPPARICKGPCHRKLPIDQFHHTKQSPDGHKHICKTCYNARQLTYAGFDPREIGQMIDRALRKPL